MSFGDLMLEVADTFGLAQNVDANGDDSAAAIPTDASRLDKLKRCVNQGYKSFISGMDPLGKMVPYTQWNFLDQIVSIVLSPDGTGPMCIAGDNSRYRLPSVITSRPKHAWTLTLDGRTLYRIVEDTTSHRVATFLAASATVGTVGYPYMAACRPIPAPEGNESGGQWEVLVAPRPNLEATMFAQFRLNPRKMTDVNERHVCGAQHDATIRAMCILEWARGDVKDQNAFARFQQDASVKLAASVMLDTNFSPRTVGMVNDPGLTSTFIARSTGRRVSGVINTYTASGA